MKYPLPPPYFYGKPIDSPLTRGMYVYVRARIVSGGPEEGTVAVQIVNLFGKPAMETHIVAPASSVVPAHHIKK
jgi:hypothetical protein